MNRLGDGGRAFPCDTTDGMTLRDYFAAKAMQAAVTAWNTKSTDCAACVASAISEESYEIADAMLIARNT
jgi:hypothetical protein